MEPIFNNKFEENKIKYLKHTVYCVYFAIKKNEEKVQH